MVIATLGIYMLNNYGMLLQHITLHMSYILLKNLFLKMRGVKMSAETRDSSTNGSLWKAVEGNG